MIKPFQPAARLGRAAAIERLVVTIADCQERDLRFILSAVLEDICAGEPAPDFSGVDQEAGNWGALASDDELRAYFVACGDRLARDGLGPRGKIRLAQRPMADMSHENLATVRTGFCGRFAWQPTGSFSLSIRVYDPVEYRCATR
ncbi:hypothetical protein [Paracoccus pacificus]|uniref:Uncharacterized protein n=1 Tax=Paracoccus pacificus TaxID=1463598 RepID=A0ABW4R5B3_9RHOB